MILFIVSVHMVPNIESQLEETRLYMDGSNTKRVIEKS